jgi:hypothetical protein
VPPKSNPTTLEEDPSTTGKLLMIPLPNVEPAIRIPRISLRQNSNNPNARETHNYSLIDELEQSPTVM